MDITKQQLHRIIYSMHDFELALSALHFLDEVDYGKKYTLYERRRFRCYESTAIIAGIRPFTSQQINLNIIGIKLSPEENKLLERIKKLRNKVVAHSDEDEMYFNIDPFAVDDESNIYHPNIRFNESLLMDENTVEEFSTILRKLISAIRKYIFQLTQKTPEELRRFVTPARFNEQ